MLNLMTVLHYHKLRADQKAALSLHRGNFDQFMSLSTSTQMKLQWWIDNISVACNDILQIDYSIVIMSDASLSGYSCALNGTGSGGQ